MVRERDRRVMQEEATVEKKKAENSAAQHRPGIHPGFIVEDFLGSRGLLDHSVPQG